MEMEKITLGGGCFWCVEAVMQRLKGVEQVRSGYMGGVSVNPTYQEVCTGKSGHIEVVEIEFDPNIIDLETILQVFWTTHNPTTLERQGNDKGPQYSSVIFYYEEAQKLTAEKSMQEIASQLWEDPIVTMILPAQTFYSAEDYHQNYYNQNKFQGYCQFIISPKITKLKRQFTDILKN